jgi:hypothetical protein
VCLHAHVAASHTHHVVPRCRRTLRPVSQRQRLWVPCKISTAAIRLSLPRYPTAIHVAHSPTRRSGTRRPGSSIRLDRCTHLPNHGTSIECLYEYAVALPIGCCIQRVLSATSGAKRCRPHISTVPWRTLLKLAIVITNVCEMLISLDKWSHSAFPHDTRRFEAKGTHTREFT